MNSNDIEISAIDGYLSDLEEGQVDKDRHSLGDESDEWFEKAAADFLSKPEIDPTLAEILEATKQFTRKNFALRAGLLYRQQLQNTPSYEVVKELEADLIELAGAANGLYEAKACAGTAYDDYTDTTQAEAEFKKRLIYWAAEDLMPKLEGTKVVKVTRSTKKPKNMLVDCPPAMMAQLGIKYKALLEKHINPLYILGPLADSVAGCNTRDWMGSYTGRDTAPAGALLNQLWTAKERKQWLYGLAEYATELVNLVAHATALDPTIKPSKYLCFFQKKSESTLYRGQEEIEALVKNMQADKLLPVYGAGEANSTPPEEGSAEYAEWYAANVWQTEAPKEQEPWESPYSAKAAKRKREAAKEMLDEPVRGYGRRAGDVQPKLWKEPESGSDTAPTSLAERLRAKRGKS